MPQAPITFVPPFRAPPAADRGPVAKRHVLYVPGYDPDQKVRSRALFIRELGRYGRRFGLARKVSAARDLPEVPAQVWMVRAARDDWAVETTYEVLLWDDIVARDFRRPSLATALALCAVTWGTVVTGLAARLFRTNWRFGAVFTYPYLVILLSALAAAAAGFAAGAVAGGLGGSGWVRGLAGAAGTGVVLALLLPRFNGWYVWHLLRDWLFNWEHGSGRRDDYSARVDRFAERLCVVVAGTEADEVLVVGHSSGATTAMEVASRALLRDPALGRRGPEVAALTLGTSLPAAAYHPKAEGIHADLRRLMSARDVLWVEYQAPQDWLNAAWFNPVRMLPLGLTEESCTNPVIRSARFSDLVSEEVYRAMRFNPFRMHFQFMMANDRAGEYDWFMIALGPWRLSRRIADPDGAAALVQPVTETLEPASGIAESLNTETARP
jgi:hypothetical protein